MTPPNLQRQQKAHFSVILEQIHRPSKETASSQGLWGCAEMTTQKKRVDSTLDVLHHLKSEAQIDSQRGIMDQVL